MRVTCLGVVLGTDNMSCIIIQFLHNENNNIITEENIIVQKVNINLKKNPDEINKEKTITN